tara:strand:+ start:2569 stop:2685 length:117 start_codon:yes stop_codon:yes gene_type:complete
MNIEIITNKRETTIKRSNLSSAIKEISDINNMLNPCLG